MGAAAPVLAPGDARLRSPEGQASIVAALRDAAAFGAPGANVDVVETHISYVFLVGDAAYKVKKAVRLPFLDFSTLEARRRFCEVEVALNRRTAPSLYLGVVPIAARGRSFAVGAEGPPVEWAVRMRRFPPDALLSTMLEQGAVDGGVIDALAARVASFHSSLAGGRAAGGYGTPEHALRLALDNLAELQALVALVPDRDRIAALRAWMLQEHAARAALMSDRHVRGFVRECHGDLHLGNVAMIDGAPTPFDCIDFDPALRWSDVASDIAFTAMDLRARGRPDFARRFVNRYLEITGDYGGAALQPFFVVHRALVRAKVALLRAGGATNRADAARAREDALAYLELAASETAHRRPAIVAMHGLSGCGKTTLSQALVEAVDCIRIRMDVERKRQHGLDAQARTGGAVDEGLYAPQASRAVYGHVAGVAEALARAGQRVVVDAAFLSRWQRDRFREAAERADAAFIIVDLPASAHVLRERVARRAAEGRDASDADLAVLEHQFATQELLGDDELADVVAFDADLPTAATLGSPRWHEWVAALAQAGKDGDGTAAGIAERVAFLSQAEHYPERPAAVEVIETHRSWVFLTDLHAWKLKKPIRLDALDHRTVRARQRNAQAELELNRRLSSGVYLDVVPLVRTPSGALAIGGAGKPVDWLVKMRRLASERMLDVQLRRGSVSRAAVVALVSVLVAYYRQAAMGAQSGAEHRDRLRDEIGVARDSLCRPYYQMPLHEIDRVASALVRFVERNAPLLDDRVTHGRVIEAHGDLRPEHVCLEERPQIIDCLEFSRAVRVQDTADELGFLALECERLGAPAMRDAIFGAYAEVSGDAVPDALVHFYQAYRALVRARIAVRHFDDPAVRDATRWRAQALDYLRLARGHAMRCAE